MREEKKDLKKYSRRNHFLNDKIIENSKCNNNYQSSYFSEILKKNENLKYFARDNKNNINNIKNNIKNIFSTDESRLKAIKYIIKTRKEKRELSPSYKLINNELFPKEEKIRENTPNESKIRRNYFYNIHNDKDKDEFNNKIFNNYNKRRILMSSDNIIIPQNDDFNNIHIKKENSKERHCRKYNKRIIKKEEKDNNNKINNNNIFSYLNHNIENNLHNNNIKLKNFNKRKNDINNNDKINLISKKEEEKNCLNISFSEEGNFILNEKDDNINNNINGNNNEYENNKLLIINSHEISFRSLKNENEENNSNNSINNSFDVKEFKNCNCINKNILPLAKCLENTFNIINNKQYKFKFESENDLINYIQNGNIKINNKTINIIYNEELNNIKKENNKYNNEINKLNKEKELYSNELIRLQKENILLRQKINEVFYAYQETYKAYINLKEENEKLKLNIKNKDIRTDLNIESNININITNNEKIKLSDLNNNGIQKFKKENINKYYSNNRFEKKKREKLNIDLEINDKYNSNKLIKGKNNNNEMKKGNV